MTTPGTREALVGECGADSGRNRRNCGGRALGTAPGTALGTAAACAAATLAWRAVPGASMITFERAADGPADRFGSIVVALGGAAGLKGAEVGRTEGVRRRVAMAAARHALL
eukprot:jgi/Chrpa1/1300/Chrysochromulina_OHIO_Genome00009514-RA